MGQDVKDLLAEPSPDVWLTLHEAATLLAVSPSTLRRWADAGRIPTQRTTGGHRRFDPPAVQQLAQEQRRSAAPPLQPLAPLAPAPPGQQPWHDHLAHSP